MPEAHQVFDVLIIGCGASGLLASIAAAKNGKRVLVLEKMALPARKLRITGKGRCNLTNVAPLSEFLKHIGPDPRFLKSAFSRFFSEDLIRLIEEAGVSVITEQGGRVFPESESAQDVVDALVGMAKKLGVKIYCNHPVSHISTANGAVTALVFADGSEMQCSRIILASGGCSYPATGSTGDGYRIAKETGHEVREALPGLVPFETEGDIAQSMQGLSLKNIQVNVWVNGKKAGEAFGEMLFTHFGVSGPVILSLSRRFVKEVLEGKPVEFSIDMKPALDHDKLDTRLLRDMNEHGKKSYQSLLKLLLPSGMVPAFCALTGIPGEKQAHQISGAERKKIRLLLKDFRLKILRPRGFQEAIITMGGVSTKDINPDTMESKRISGLFFCGEIIDLDADTGGYNLQIAFSTGFVAGKSV